MEVSTRKCTKNNCKFYKKKKSIWLNKKSILLYIMWTSFPFWLHFYTWWFTRSWEGESGRERGGSYTDVINISHTLMIDWHPNHALATPYWIKSPPAVQVASFLLTNILTSKNDDLIMIYQLLYFNSAGMFLVNKGALWSRKMILTLLKIIMAFNICHTTYGNDKPPEILKMSNLTPVWFEKISQ